MAEYKVVDIEKLEAGLTATADAIRLKTGGTEQIEWKENGMADQMDQVFEAGKKSEYDVFWDAYQDNGNRVQYYYGFSGYGWNDQTFKPKYNIICSGNQGMLFAYSKITDLISILKRTNIIIDFSRATNFSQLLTDSTITTFPSIDSRNSSQLNNILFGAYSLKTIEKIILKEDGSQLFNDNSFYVCTELEDIIFEGTIGTNLNFQWSSKLSKNSITNIINALLATSADTIITFSQIAVNSAFETSTGAADGSTSEEWLALATTKPNWTISLV